MNNYRSFGAAWNAIVDEVDGQSTPWVFRESSTARNFLFNGPAGGEKSIDLTPGPHTVKVSLFWDQLMSGDSEDAWTKSSCVLSFDALPGERYDLASTYWLSRFGQWFTGERDWTAWVVRSSTRDVVSTNECTPGTDDAVADAK